MTGHTIWVYVQSEANLWTVGFYSPDGKWHPDYDWHTQDEAAERVHYLHGGSKTDWKEQARAHEESANEYARMNYKLEAENERLLNVLANKNPESGWAQVLVERQTILEIKAIIADLLEALKEAAYMICLLCRRLNPQHTDCTQCDDIDSIRKAIHKAEE